MSAEAHIKTILEDYLNTETDLKGYVRAKAEASKMYTSLLSKHTSSDHSYSIHTAAPVIGAYEEIKNLNQLEQEATRKLHEISKKIKEYIRALNGCPLEASFSFDSLNHRAGTHTFYLENDELKIRHSLVS